jgi:glycosyltransferase involved in cell wall biosynthesis
MNQSSAPGQMLPDLAAQGDPPTDFTARLARRSHRATAKAGSTATTRRPLMEPEPVDACAPVGLAGVPTIVAIGPFDDRAEAHQLAAAFITVRQQCKAQLVLLGGGVHRPVVIRETAERAVGKSVHVVRNPSDYRWSDLIAAADLVVLGSSSGTTTLLNVLAEGRPVVAPADPATVELVVPGIVGLVYPPGDVSGMAGALLRLLTTPLLRRGMGGRARQVARRYRLEAIARHESAEWSRP